jgi:hypothetical protein
VLLAGCVRVNQQLTLESDGSGTLALIYGVKEDDLRRMAEIAETMDALDPAAKPASGDWLNAFDEATIRREWSEGRYVGVELKSVFVRERDGWRFMEAEIGFDSLQHLIDTGLLGECHLSLSRGPDGQYGFLQEFDVAKAARSLPAGMDITSFRPMLGMMMSDFHADLNVSVPGRILRSNSKQVTGRTARWVFDGSEPGLIDRLEQTTLLVLFDGTGLQLAETRKRM